MRCPSCGFDNPPAMRFCGGCGGSLGAAPAARPAEPSRDEAERRQLTFLVTDLVGSTALSQRLDAEDYRELTRRYQEVVATAVEARGGSVVQYLGDGVLAYFGYPLAFEDAPRRAVRAALDVTAGMARLSREQQERLGVELAVRVAVHSGLAVVGAMTAGTTAEHLATGAAASLAGRLQELAAPGEVVVSEAAYRLVGGGFDAEPLGARSISGSTRPVVVYRVRGEREDGTVTRFTGTGFTVPLVDREPERATLAAAYARLAEGRGGALLVHGDAGIGKSRLLADIVAGLPEGHLLVEGGCSPDHQASALHPLVATLGRGLGFAPGDAPEVRLEKLAAGVERAGLPRDEAMPLLAALLSLPAPAGLPPLGLSPQRARQRTLELLVDWALSLAAARPTTLWLEDVHWSDPSTLEWLGLLVARLGDVPLQLLLTARPGFRAPWPGVEELALERLPPHHLATLVRHVAGERTLATETVDRVVARTDGIPLFAEELTRAMLEQATGDGGEIPATLQDSLLARLDRLGPAKWAAQWAATLGREVDHQLLAAVVPYPHDDLRAAVDRLLATGILEPASGSQAAAPRWRFRHALIQEAAYATLLKRQRREQHQVVARSLESDVFADRAAAQPEEVARHWTEAGVATRAIPWWLTAGRLALERSAHREAVHHLTTGLELARAAGDEEDEDEEAAISRELELLMSLGPALLAGRGYAAGEVAETFSRARELCRRLGATPLRFAALRGLVPYYLVRSELGVASGLGEELLAAAEAAASDDLAVEAHLALATVRFWQGEVRPALAHAEASLAAYAPRHVAHAVTYGQDPSVLARLYVAWCRAWLGEAAAARAAAGRALADARRLGHLHTLAMALDHGSAVHQYLGDVAGARVLVEEAARLAEEQGFAMWRAMAGFRRGWIAVHDGGAAGLETMRRGLESFRRTGARLARPLHNAHLAEACALLGRTADGLAAVDAGLEAVAQHGERHYEPELHRLRGELLAQAGGGAAEAALERAWTMARERGARELALRAGTSLARRLAGSGRAERARTVVGEALEPFVATSVDDLPDLAPGRALAAELAARANTAAAAMEWGERGIGGEL